MVLNTRDTVLASELVRVDLQQKISLLLLLLLVRKSVVCAKVNIYFIFRNLTLSNLNKPKMAYSHDLPKMQCGNHGLSWIIMD